MCATGGHILHAVSRTPMGLATQMRQFVWLRHGDINDRGRKLDHIFINSIHQHPQLGGSNPN
jgi:hypothetical protein